MHQRRILVVDDDADFREVINVWLARENVEVILASNGDEALQLLGNSGSADLVLTDFMMPELNGIELVRALKADTKLFNIPIVVMSANVDPEFRKRAIELGASAYLAKSEGARVVAEKAIGMITCQTGIPASPARSAPNDQVQAMQQSLLALIRLASQIDGMPVAAKSALLSAERLAESLFAEV